MIPYELAGQDIIGILTTAKICLFGFGGMIAGGIFAGLILLSRLAVRFLTIKSDATLLFYFVRLKGALLNGLQSSSYERHIIPFLLQLLTGYLLEGSSQ